MFVLGEGVSAALRWEDLSKFCEDFGFARPRLVSATPFEIGKEEYRTIVGRTRLGSIYTFDILGVNSSLNNWLYYTTVARHIYIFYLVNFCMG